LNKLLCQNVIDYAILFFLIATMANKRKRDRNLWTKFKKTKGKWTHSDNHPSRGSRTCWRKC